MTIRVIGSSHHLAPPSRLQEAVSRKEQLFAHLVRLQSDQRIHGAVLLATCNRLELILDVQCTDPDLPRTILAPDDGADHIDLPYHDHLGSDAAHYLLRVATGLESMVRGEDQILGQLREAFKVADRHGLLSARLRVLRTQLIAAARDTRQRTGMAKIEVSVASLAARELERAGRRLVVIGAGETGRLALETLTRRGNSTPLIVNRTFQRAAALANHFGTEALSLKQFLATAEQAAEPPWDGVLLAIDSTRPILDARHVRGLRMVVDVSMPSVLDASLKQQPGLEVLDLDAIARLVQEEGERRSACLQIAEDLVAGKARSLHSALTQVGSGAHLSSIFEQHLETAYQELQATLETKLSHLSETDREHVRQAVLRTTKRNAHLHLKSVRELSKA